MPVIRLHKPSGAWQVFRGRGGPSETPAYTSYEKSRAQAWRAEHFPGPGRPKGAGSMVIQYRVTDAQYAELKREGRGNANAAAKARAFPASPPGGAT